MASPINRALDALCERRFFPKKRPVILKSFHIISWRNQYIGKLFRVEFQKAILTYAPNYRTHTPKDAIFIQVWIFRSPKFTPVVNTTAKGCFQCWPNLMSFRRRPRNSTNSRVTSSDPAKSGKKTQNKCQSSIRDPFHEVFFSNNSNWVWNSFNSNPIPGYDVATNDCICHDNTAVVLYASMCSYQLTRIGMRSKRNSITSEWCWKNY